MRRSNPGSSEPTQDGWLWKSTTPGPWDLMLGPCWRPLQLKAQSWGELSHSLSLQGGDKAFVKVAWGQGASTAEGLAIVGLGQDPGGGGHWGPGGEGPQGPCSGRFLDPHPGDPGPLVGWPSTPPHTWPGLFPHVQLSERHKSSVFPPEGGPCRRAGGRELLPPQPG